MADVEKTVSILFQGKDSLTDSVNKMEKGLNKFSDRAQDVTQPLANVATSILEINAAINILLAGGLILATKKAGEFGDSFNEISTLIDASAQDIGQFKDDVLSYATDSKKSIDEINAAVYTAISAGTDYQDSLALTAQSEKLAIASKADLEPTLRLLASTMNAYGAEADEAQKYSDLFFETVRDGQTTLPEISSSLAQVSNIAANAGVPIETLTAGIATLTKKGQETPQAITSIRGAITAIIKPTDEAAELAEKLGIQFDAEALASKGLEGVLNDVMKATGGNTAEISKLFGNVRGLTGALGLAGDGGKVFREILDDMQNSAGATEIAYGKMADNFGLANQKLVNNINATIIKIGDKIIDKYGDVVGALTGAVRVIGEGVDSSTFAPIWAMLDEFADDLVKGFNDIRDNLPDALKLVDVGPLVDSYKNLGGALKDAIEAVFGRIDLTTPEGLAAVIQKIVDSMKVLNNISAGVIDGLRPFLSWIGTAIDKFKDMDDATAEVAGKLLGVATGLNAILGHSKAITGFFAALAGSSLVNATANILSLGGAVTTLSGPLAILAPAAITAGAAAGIVILTDKLTDTLAPVINDTIDYFDNLAGSIFGYESATAKAAREQQEFIDDLADFDAQFTDIAGSIDAINDKINDSGSTAEDVSKALDDWGMTQKGWEKVNGAWINVKYKAEIDETSVDNVVDKVEEIPAEKVIEPILDEETIEDQIEKIKAQAEIVATSIEWKAKLDIAEVEAASKNLETMFDSINQAIDSTGGLIGDLFGTLAGGDLDILGRADIDRAIQAEERRREDSFNLQKELTMQQIKLNDLKLEALERGDALINIDGTGLQPELEAFMWKILEAIQVRANAEGAEFLLGV